MKIDLVTKQYQKLVKFQERHKLKIDFKKNLLVWAELVVKIKRCPCNLKRHKCPCRQALKEIKRDGCCSCKLFYAK